MHVMVMIFNFRNAVFHKLSRIGQKNAKYYVQMCKKLQLLGLGTSTPDPLPRFAPGPHWGTFDPPAALSGK